MGVPATLSAGKTGKGIRICMFLTPPVHNVEVQLLQPLQPPCELTLRFFEVAQPGEGPMISTQQETLASQIRAVLFSECHYCQQLATCYAVSSFGLRKKAAPIGDDSFLTFTIDLREDRSDACVTSVSIEDEPVAEIRVGEDGGGR